MMIRLILNNSSKESIIVWRPFNFLASKCAWRRENTDSNFWNWDEDTIWLQITSWLKIFSALQKGLRFFWSLPLPNYCNLALSSPFFSRFSNSNAEELIVHLFIVSMPIYVIPVLSPGLNIRIRTLKCIIFFKMTLIWPYAFKRQLRASQPL